MQHKEKQARGVCFFISRAARTYNPLEVNPMKSQSLIVTEHHPPAGLPPEQTIRQTITAWLTKELRRGGAANPLRDLYTPE